MATRKKATKKKSTKKRATKKKAAKKKPAKKKAVKKKAKVQKFKCPHCKKVIAVIDLESIKDTGFAQISFGDASMAGSSKLFTHH